MTEQELKLVFPPWEQQINKKYPKLLVFRTHTFDYFTCLCYADSRYFLPRIHEQYKTPNKFGISLQTSLGCGWGTSTRKAVTQSGVGPVWSIWPALITASIRFARVKAEHWPDQAGPPAREFKVRLFLPRNLKGAFNSGRPSSFPSKVCFLAINSLQLSVSMSVA